MNYDKLLASSTHYYIVGSFEEGSFGVIKQDLRYERFRRTSINKVSLEFMLVSLGYNIRKLFKFYDGNAKFN